MTLRPILVTFICAIACALPAFAAPDDQPPSSSRSGPVSKGVSKRVDYGFCSGRQNAHSYAPSPVKIVVEMCRMSQTFSATSDGPSTGHNCGGYAIAFGPKGNLNPSLNEITMVAEWADQPLTTASACDKARVTALAWGERCVNAACDKTTWDKIEGGPKQRDGKWDSANQKCTIEVKFTSQGVGYRTLNLDIIADYPEGNQYVRKRAKGTIVAAKKDTKPCYNAGEASAAKK
jgi:hypothetical protein